MHKQLYNFLKNDELTYDPSHKMLLSDFLQMYGKYNTDPKVTRDFKRLLAETAGLIIDGDRVLGACHSGCLPTPTSLSAPAPERCDM